ncbi:MAG: hypothetical protein QOJ09_1832 [Actinomycetota bacterium]|nr:hypothetical protein [Actinomycetota bacterium]
MAATVPAACDDRWTNAALPLHPSTKLGMHTTGVTEGGEGDVHATWTSPHEVDASSVALDKAGSMVNAPEGTAVGSVAQLPVAPCQFMRTHTGAALHRPSLTATAGPCLTYTPALVTPSGSTHVADAS